MQDESLARDDMLRELQRMRLHYAQSQRDVVNHAHEVERMHMQSVMLELEHKVISVNRMASVHFYKHEFSFCVGVQPTGSRCGE